MKFLQTPSKGIEKVETSFQRGGAKMGYMSKTCIVYIAKWCRMKFFCDFFVGSLGSLRFLPYFCIAIGTQGSLAKSQRA